MTAEGWTKVQESLTTNDSNFGVYFFLISFIFIGHFIFGNLFVAVVIEQIDKGTYRLHLYLFPFSDTNNNYIIRKNKIMCISYFCFLKNNFTAFFFSYCWLPKEDRRQENNRYSP